MKKILATLMLVAGLGSSYAGEPNIYENNTERANSINPGHDGVFFGDDDPEPNVPPSPINDYLPVLIIAGVALAAYMGRKQSAKA
ncbi:hypothetical protein SAMN05443429_106109 [Cruoricaptor ignavus]|uniref:PEP-CTERM protein-sorting domain-containing protein n=1 Tax=Cruoricaptor ignavus TaxID=1118202 RepID=A0A1M6F5C3_9FLAO|nr:hypothetical protein [Cruoricaptor ignavus]QOR73646.1 hypothetical protein IMZ16_09045 [Cruoricaptor ignavus]SHI92873.1 hypothetical protein SAMN05443429_106109 [Cruoricaptor ignavus]